MNIRKTEQMLLCILLVVLLVVILSGCRPETEPIEEEVSEESEAPAVVEQEEPETEEEAIIGPLTPTTFYWPWLSHGHLDLSSGEVILGPDLFESELGFIAEFTEDTAFQGQVFWLVRESDVFELEWVTLAFNVEYYKQNEWVYDLNFEFEIDDLQPEPGDDGIQEFTVNLVEQQQSFEVVVKTVKLGKEQEGSFSTDPINYVAIEMEMRVLGNP